MKQAISIFNDIGLEYRIVKADAGNIGGDVSEEFHILADSEKISWQLVIKVNLQQMSKFLSMKRIQQS